jgi:hydrogenase maturation protein HypF
MIERQVHSPRTSSCGRLFDAVSALAGIRQVVSYEAQAALELEMAAGDAKGEKAYPFELVPDGEGWQIQTAGLFEFLLRDLQRGEKVEVISARFHRGLIETLAQLARRIRQRTNLNRVCLSGGCFQNRILLNGMSARLGAHGFEVFTHADVPAGDGGLSLGQALVAAHSEEEPTGCSSAPSPA